MPCYYYSRIFLLVEIIWVGVAPRLLVTWLQALGNPISTIFKYTEDVRLDLSAFANSEVLKIKTLEEIILRITLISIQS